MLIRSIVKNPVLKAYYLNVICHHLIIGKTVICLRLTARYYYLLSAFVLSLPPEFGNLMHLSSRYCKKRIPMGGVAGDVNAFSTVDIEIQFQPIVGNLTHHCWEGNKNLKFLVNTVNI